MMLGSQHAAQPGHNPHREEQNLASQGRFAGIDVADEHDVQVIPANAANHGEHCLTGTYQEER